MENALRILTAFLGIGFALQGLGWLLVPPQAAAGLGMPLLDGVGRSTQIGDFAAFFVTAGVGMVLGSRRGHTQVLLFPAALLASAAVGRTLAWMLHGATFAALFIAVEVAASLLLLTVARRYG